jgi:ABC-2 type transport system ATP-binding protein
MPAIIETRDLTRRFGELTAVDKLNLTVAEGEIFGLVGPDGAGKTTTLRMLCGLVDPTSGSARVAGYDTAKQSQEVKDQIGYMAQRFGLYGDLTVEENMTFYADLFGIVGEERRELTGRLLHMTRMEPFRNRQGGRLSGGMKQKLALMCTLLHKPRVLFLDEPTNGVDPLSRRDFWVILKRLAAEGMTILVSTAYLDEAERCDRVGLMYKGRLIEVDPPSKMREAWAPYSFAVEGADRRAARKALHGKPFILGAEPAGAELHVYVEPSHGTAADVVGALHEAGFAGATLRPINPSLEDVFIALIRREERRAAA